MPSVPAHLMNGATVGRVLPILLAAVVIIVRNSQARKLKVERLWMFPIVYLVLLGVLLYAAPPAFTPLSVAVLAAALAVGAGLGWQRGRLIRIDVDPETHEMTAQASIIGVVFILVVMLARYGMGMFLSGNASLAGVPAATVLDALVVLAVGMLTTQRIEIWLRATKLLEASKAAKLAASNPPPTQPPLVS